MGCYSGNEVIKVNNKISIEEKESILKNNYSNKICLIKAKTKKNGEILDNYGIGFLYKFINKINEKIQFEEKVLFTCHHVLNLEIPENKKIILIYQNEEIEIQIDIFYQNPILDYTCIKINNETINEYIEEKETKNQKDGDYFILTKDNNELILKKFNKLDYNDKYIEYQVDTINGDSGSPLILFGEEVKIEGIHRKMNPNNNKMKIGSCFKNIMEDLIFKMNVNNNFIKYNGENNFENLKKKVKVIIKEKDKIIQFNNDLNDAKELFKDLKSKELDLYLQTFQIYNMEKMFYNCSNLGELCFTEIKTFNVNNMSEMFYNCSNLVELDLTEFNTVNVKNMSGMFYNCSNLVELDLTEFNTVNVKNMSGMFYNCSNLKKIKFSPKFQTFNVLYMYDMFNGCKNITELNLNDFNVRNVLDSKRMFSNCEKLSILKINNSWKFRKVKIQETMFEGCKKISQNNFLEMLNKIY